jgi:hypothetical protein
MSDPRRIRSPANRPGPVDPRARHLGRPKRDDTDDPRRSRERALKILFQADVRGVSPEDVLRQVAHDEDGPGDARRPR